MLVFLSSSTWKLSLSTGLHGFRWEMGFHLNWCFPISNVLFLSGCFEDFFFVFSFLKFNYDVLAWIHLCLFYLCFVQLLESLHLCGLLSRRSLRLCLFQPISSVFRLGKFCWSVLILIILHSTLEHIHWAFLLHLLYLSAL